MTAVCGFLISCLYSLFLHDSACLFSSAVVFGPGPGADVRTPEQTVRAIRAHEKSKRGAVLETSDHAMRVLAARDAVVRLVPGGRGNCLDDFFSLK